MEIQKILITPSLASQYLEANIKNRAVKLPVLLRYTKDMANGAWKEDTGELIKISKTGVVLDGQHRLLALKKANVSIYFHVATGLEDSIFDVLDTGSLRNATDVFYINKIKNCNRLPSTIQRYCTLKNSINTNSTHKHVLHTNAKLLELYYEKPEYWDFVVSKAIIWYRNFSHILTPQIIGGFYAHFSDINSNDAEIFMEQLCTGVGITNSAVGLCRNKLIQDKLSMKKIPSSTKNALIIKAWNCFRTNINPKILKFAADVEPAPIAI